MNRAMIKHLLVFVCVAYSCVQADIKLQLRGGLQARDDRTGQVVTVLAQDEEVVLGVICDDQVRDMQVSGLQDDAFVVRRGGTSSNMTMINGQTTSTFTHNYYISPGEPGAFTVGPATATVAGQKETSNTIMVRVLTGEEFDKLAGRSGQRQQLSCRLSADASRAVVGQKVMVTVTLEDDGNVHDRQLQSPSFGSLRATPVGQPVTEQKMENGQLRTQVTQSYQVCADAPGNYSVGPAIAHFVVPGGGGQDPFASFFSGGLGSFFGGGKKTSVRSNSLKLHIDGLPAASRPVDGVGQFDDVALHAEKKLVELNEPFMVTLSLIGNGNFDAMVAPTLQLSDQFAVYDSTNSFTPDPSEQGRGTKVFEYVVQIGEPGVHEFSPQEFTYYDTRAQRYNTMLTAPLTVQVKPAKVATSVVPPAGPKGRKEPVSEQTAMLEQEIENEVPALPWWWLLLVVVLPLLWWGRFVWQRFGFVVTEKLGITSEVRREKAALNRLVSVGDVEALHNFFVTFLARHWGCRTQEVDGVLVEERSADWGWDNKKCSAFASYIDECSQAAFAPQMLSGGRKQQLLDKAAYWHELATAALAEEGK